MKHMNSENPDGVDVVDRPPGKAKKKAEPSPPKKYKVILHNDDFCLLYTSPSPRD